MARLPDNIERNPLPHRQYTGYGNGAWRITGSTGYWQATRVTVGPTAFVSGRTLAEVGKRIADLAASERYMH